jgi:parallel beta-helix repeat protein
MNRGIGIKKLTFLLFALLILVSVSSIGTAAVILVHQGDSIQAAVNNSISGDVIIVKPGTYVKNIKIAKENLTIRSDSGDPNNTIIKARNSHADVFLLKADDIKLSGFKISGATEPSYAGIFLCSSDNCTIENNILLNNSCVIYRWCATQDKISKNMANNNGVYGGILLASSDFNILSGNTVSNNHNGIYMGTSNDNILSSNTIQNSDNLGFFICSRSNRNLVYNNYFNENKITIKNGIGNTYNTIKTPGINIIGGPYIGGNFWGKPDGTGVSQNAVNRGDGISDHVYANITGSIYSDYLPLVYF